MFGPFSHLTYIYSDHKKLNKNISWNLFLQKSNWEIQLDLVGGEGCNVRMSLKQKHVFFIQVHPCLNSITIFCVH